MKECDVPVIFHPHGSLSDGTGTESLDRFIDVGFECIYYGENCDHEKMRSLTEGRTSVMGGIDTSQTIFLGNDERIVKDTEAVLDGSEGHDYMFSCSCSIDRGLDPGKLKLMADTVRNFGRWIASSSGSS